ncbi:MAG: carboxypeptidase-like regulatory domain-containing protein [Bacteroidetes bacterium]|nr:carboxypeptidase-like regulatory domain-containing protein [Bacteroidota bacterium]
MPKIFLLLVLLLFPFVIFATRISGVVSDESNTGLAFAVVYVKGTSIGTTTNSDGFYFLDLAPGNYKIGFQLIGYQQIERTITIAQESYKLNVQLAPSSFLLKAIQINAAAEDPAYAVIRAAQKRRKYYLNLVKSYSCNVYIKGMEKVTKYPPKKIAGIRVSIGGLIDSASGILYLSESESNYYFSQPDKVQEEMIASKTSGKKNGFSYNRASDMDFNFYESAIKNTALSVRGFISPIAPAALRNYKYKLLGTFQENGEMINKIQVIPKRKEDAVFSGVIYIVENSWRIHSTDLMLDKNAGIEYVDTLRITQEYIQVKDSIWMPFKNNFEYIFGALGFRGKGVYNAVISNYRLEDISSSARFTGAAITFSEDALNRDSAYWESKRIIPLTQAEIKDYSWRDSIEIVHSSNAYIDSVEKIKNKFKWNNIIDGYTNESSLRKTRFEWKPMYNHISFNTVQGVVVAPTFVFTKKIASLKSIEAGGTAAYGFSNKAYYGFGNLSYTYNSKRFAKLSLSGGKDMLQFNSNVISPLVNTLYTLLLKDNFMKIFEKYYIRMEHTTELMNGLILFNAVEYADRNPLRNTTSFSLIKSNKEFQSNDPLIPDNQQFAFFRNQSFHVEAALQFTPYQRYYFNRGEKLLQDSKYPSFTLFYKRAIKNILNSDVDLDLIKLGAEGNINWKRAGVFHYSLEAGRFVNRTQMSFMDWKYFNGNKTLYSNFSGKQFQLLDYYSNSTNNEFAEIHLQQNFNGAILNKVPLLKRAKIQELITVNFVVTNGNFHYEEAGIGLQKLFIRVDYVFGFKNGVYSDSSLRFGFLF